MRLLHLSIVGAVAKGKMYDRDGAIRLQKYKGAIR
jgi:hypothetical protein